MEKVGLPDGESITKETLISMRKAGIREYKCKKFLPDRESNPGLPRTASNLTGGDTHHYTI